jgi:formate hydrogenlyase subunit 3/multisubunit Na+/H+ antiporter MnhD subunit
MIFSIVTLLTLSALLLLVFARADVKGLIAIGVVLMNAALSSVFAVSVLIGKPIDISVYAGLIFGEVSIRLDSLSAWFLLIMNLTIVTGIFYGVQYMSRYRNQPSNLTLHYISYVVNHLAMIGVYTLQNSLAFLCTWELMTISAFLLVIFDHNKIKTLKAGINFLVQSHIGILFLTVGFIWVGSHTGSYDFNGISQYSANAIPTLSFLLYSCFFIGFAFKAGFVPFHTWLPYAHPAAPAHVSGIMSGVLIKLGIFGIMRMLLLIKENQLLVGYSILTISLITGVYGVVLAIIQNNLKKLLAYSSIENVGIIGIGIGVGTIGLGLGKPYLIFAGFAGALLHTLNHSLIKSLLFYGAGTIYQATHTVDIEKLGGLIKKIPQTTALFLVASLAIAGVPPLNGFISELLIYSGLFNGIHSDRLMHTLTMITAIFSLTVIGGLAILCFTKAFGVVFLGTERQSFSHSIDEANPAKFFPKYIIVLIAVAIGVFPQFFVRMVSQPVMLFADRKLLIPAHLELIDATQKVSLSAWGLILLSLLILSIKRMVGSSRPTATAPTWGCGYTAPTPQLQYTSNSFTRSFRKLVHPLLIMNKRETIVEGAFPEAIHSETNPYDKIEVIFIEKPARIIRAFMGRFKFVQNGSVQIYVSYGVAFILIAIAMPVLSKVVEYLIILLKRM